VCAGGNKERFYSIHALKDVYSKETRIKTFFLDPWSPFHKGFGSNRAVSDHAKTGRNPKSSQFIPRHK
jgi:hypothetical protein